MVTKPGFIFYKSSFKQLHELNWSTYIRKNCPRIHNGKTGELYDKILQDQEYLNIFFTWILKFNIYCTVGPDIAVPLLPPLLCWLKNILFTSFSGHRPAQRECAWKGLRSHVRCHPYPIPQPVKAYHTTRIYNPYSFQIVMWVLLQRTRTNQWKCCEIGPTVFHLYWRRLESLSTCRSHYKGSSFFLVI